MDSSMAIPNIIIVKLFDVLSNVSLISILIYIIIELLMFNLK